MVDYHSCHSYRNMVQIYDKKRLSYFISCNKFFLIYIIPVNFF
ncbi:hypothetical protein SAMN04487826_1311 [Prevotella sp. khp1]|nr:hypothetical protein SAMN04487826_1311 [Prevotella sp. khp1]